MTKRGWGNMPKADSIEPAKPRQLSRTETHDLGMIIKDRAKVLKSYADEQAAACMADFEKKLAKVYAFDEDEVWHKANKMAHEAMEAAQQIITERCKALGIPKDFAPGLSMMWHGRGQNAIASRRSELRRVAKTTVDAMVKAATTQIDKQSLHLRTQVVGMGIMSPEAKLFLESLAPIEDSMQMLEFVEIERKLTTQRLPDYTRGGLGS